MNRLGSLVLLIGGVVLMAYAVDAYHSVASGVSRVFTGAPPDKVLGFKLLPSPPALPGDTNPPVIAGMAVVSVAGAVIHPTNPPPSLPLAWDAGEARQHQWTVVSDHGDGGPATTNLVNTNALVFTNFNFNEPWRIRVRWSDTNGLAAEAQLFLGVRMAGATFTQPYRAGGNWLAFWAEPGNTYTLRRDDDFRTTNGAVVAAVLPAAAAAPNLTLNNAPGVLGLTNLVPPLTNRLMSVAVPAAGYYRMERR